MPILVVLFVVLFFIVFPLRRNLRLQGPRSRLPKLSPAELREANPQLLPRLSPLGYPRLRLPPPTPPTLPLPHEPGL